MRFVLAGILAILPLTAQTESLAFMDIGESDSESAAPLANTEHECNVLGPEDEVGFCRSPYNPASPTNFLTLIGPYSDVQAQRDLVLHESRFPGLVEVPEGGAGKRDLTNDRYETGVSSTLDSWRIPATTPGWPPYGYGGRN